VASFVRATSLAALGAAPFDVLVIGGGMTGCGTAVDLATRGLSVALVEAEDFASGTSSKSSKMVHGGLRYLQQREFRLVYENLHERQRLLRNAPHLVSPLPFLIPLFGDDGVVSKAVARSYKMALWLYDLTGGLRIGHRHREIGRSEVIDHFPTLDVSELVAGFLYFDARGDDARVALCLAQTAADLGAVVASYAPATAFLRDGRGRVTGAVISPGGPGEDDLDPIEVRARVVVNAAGVFADEVSSLDESEVLESLTPAKGVHVSVPASRLPCDIAAVLPVPEDRRSVFVVPWPDAPFVYIGTTDTAYDGDLHDPRCQPDDVAYLLGAINKHTSASLTPADVTGVWAGLRPLLKPQSGRTLSLRTADLSRRHRVETEADGVVSITGGKWTTYRKMAEDAGDEIARQLPGVRRSATRRLSLHGAPGKGHPPKIGLEPGMAQHLERRYGTDAATVAAIVAEDPANAETVIDGLAYVVAEIRYAARHEMVVRLDDVLSRRTRAELQDARAARRAAPAVAAILAEELDWPAGRLADEIHAFDARVAGELASAGLDA
jgi:glycerol-3-phosphate dehydrogenase